MGTITAQQHNETRRAAKQRQKRAPKSTTRPTDGFLLGLNTDRREKNKERADQAKQRRQGREANLLNEASAIIDQRLKVGSASHIVAMLVIEVFPDANKTADLSRTKVAQGEAFLRIPSDKKFSELAVEKGMRVAGHAIWQAGAKLKN